MKRTVKQILHRLRLLNAAEHLYFNAKTASASTVLNEIRYQFAASPDGIPLPPSNLIYDVIACRWKDVFLTSGKTVVDDMDSFMRQNGVELESCKEVLDFGCGCGRLIRHLGARTKAGLSGSDYNPNLVSWCANNLKFGQFKTNLLEPPLQFEANTFDFVYARSVFTHLPHDLQLKWMAELRRVLTPGGFLYFTQHGNPLAANLPPTDRERYDAGDLIVTYSDRAGENLCSSFASRQYVETNLLDGFSLVGFLEGRDITHLRQDSYLFRKT